MKKIHGNEHQFKWKSKQEAFKSEIRVIGFVLPTALKSNILDKAIQYNRAQLLPQKHQ